MTQRRDRWVWILLAALIALPTGCSDDTEIHADQQVAADSGPADGPAAEASADSAPDAASPDGGGVNRFAEAKEKKLQQALDDGVKAQGPPGGTMAARAGKKLWVGAKGLSNLAKKTAMKPGDRMRIASITKTFVATHVKTPTAANTRPIERFDRS